MFLHSCGGRVFWCHSQIIIVSQNLPSRVEEFRTTIKTPSRTLARHAPAGGVYPVLIPSQPILSNLLVLTQFLTQWIFSISSSKKWLLYSSELIISLKTGLLQQYRLKSTISLAEETLRIFDKPWGFVKTVLVRRNYLAFLFIYLRKRLTKVVVDSQQVRSIDYIQEQSLLSGFTVSQKRRSPKTSARSKAASLPEGSMAPQKRSQRRINLPSWSSAEVPF